MLTDFLCHSILGVRVIKKKEKNGSSPSFCEAKHFEGSMVHGGERPIFVVINNILFKP